MTLINRPGLLFVVIAFLLGCKHRSGGMSIEGNYVVSGSSIFLTSFYEEKEELYKVCLSKKVSISAGKLLIDSTCDFLSDVKDITIVDSFETTVDKFPILNSQSFAYFVDEDIHSSRAIRVFKARETFNDGVNDSMYIVKKTVDTIILVHDPIVLEIVRTQSNKKK